MPMREECRNYQSRTYASGEVARFCALDLAPEAPWRCPDNCGSYAPRTADVAWDHGSLVDPPVEDEPNVPSGDASALLESAEDVVNQAGPEIVADVQRELSRSERRRWRRGRRSS